MTGALLIVDRDAERRGAFAAQLRRWYHHPVEIDGADAALRAIRSSPPALVIIAADQPAPAGLDLCRRIKSEPGAPPTLLASFGEADIARRGALDAGADDFLVLPRDGEAMMARIRSILRSKTVADELELRRATAMDLGIDLAPEGAGEEHVLLVASESGDDASRDERIANVIESATNARCDLARGAFDALRRIERNPPDAVVVADGSLSEDMRNGFGEGAGAVALIRAISTTEAARNAPLLYLLSDAPSKGASRKAAAALDAGALDCAHFDEAGEELAVRLRLHLARKRDADTLRRAFDEGLRSAIRDPLTQLHNRRYFEAHFQRRLDRSREIGAPLSVLIFDIDDFKLVNDRFGHQTGDETLRRFAAVLSQEVRAADLVARFGGDEFVVVMSDATETQARTAADRLRARIARETSASVHLSASVGIAEAVQTDLRAEDVFSRADAALMASKSRRREEAERA